MKRLKEIWKKIAEKFAGGMLPAPALGALAVIALMLSLSACSSAKLKKCDSKAVDPALMHCSEQVQGSYYKCEKPQDLYVCQDPL